ncbi:MAG: DUF441 family protein [Clostridia bacterium]
MYFTFEKLIGLDRNVYPYIEKSGMTWGLILVIAAIMIPIANGSVSAENINNISWKREEDIKNAPILP